MFLRIKKCEKALNIFKIKYVNISQLQDNEQHKAVT